MAKLREDPIQRSDIEEYLNSYSDFAFELRVLRKLNELNCTEYQHGGVYTDPNTSKDRQFDIRALFERGDARHQYFLRLHLSVECKNLRDNFPLVVHSVKRKQVECYHELVRTSDHLLTSLLVERRNNRLYREGEFVAKSTDQVGRHQNTSEIIANDGSVFDKINQAINSARDLVAEVCDLEGRLDDPCFTFICPVLVIPDDRLWQISYEDDGAMSGPPEQIKRVSHYIGKKYTVDRKDLEDPLDYTISHLEIVTFSELKSFIESLLQNDRTWFG